MNGIYTIKASMREWVIRQGNRRVGFTSGKSKEGLISNPTGSGIYVKVTKVFRKM